MSLINDMLKDLDGDAAAKSAEPLPAGLQSPRTKTPTKRGWILPALAAVAVIYGLLVELNLLGLVPKKIAPPVEIPQPIALNSKWLEQGPAAKAAEPVALDPSTGSGRAGMEMDPSTGSGRAGVEMDPSTVSGRAAAELGQIPAVGEMSVTDAGQLQGEQGPVVEPQVQPTATRADPAVEKLLRAGETALWDKRLTTPAGDNAYQYFKSVLLIEPENPSARAAIAQIQQIYIGWLEQALLANRPEAARQYWLKARAAGVAPEVLADYQNRSASTFAEAGAPAAASSVPPPSISPVPSGPGDDAAAAARLLRDGLLVGEARALSWLERGTPVEQTALVLADFYAVQGEQNKLLHLQQLLSTRDSRAAVYVQAQLAARQQNYALAAEHLAGVEFTGAAEERRLRALAGFYQQLKDYTRAMPLYSRLVQMPSGGANDWLGLAVSADAQQLAAVAQHAYQNLLRLNHPDPRVMAFARQRHQDLSFSSSR